MSYEDLSSKKLKIDKLLDNISVKRSLKYNSYDRKPHWTMSLAINMLLILLIHKKDEKY